MNPEYRRPKDAHAENNGDPVKQERLDFGKKGNNADTQDHEPQPDQHYPILDNDEEYGCNGLLIDDRKPRGPVARKAVPPLCEGDGAKIVPRQLIAQLEHGKRLNLWSTDIHSKEDLGKLAQSCRLQRDVLGVKRYVIFISTIFSHQRGHGPEMGDIGNGGALSCLPMM